MIMEEDKHLEDTFKSLYVQETSEHTNVKGNLKKPRGKDSLEVDKNKGMEGAC